MYLALLGPKASAFAAPPLPPRGPCVGPTPPQDRERGRLSLALVGSPHVAQPPCRSAVPPPSHTRSEGPDACSHEVPGPPRPPPGMDAASRWPSPAPRGWRLGAASPRGGAGKRRGCGRSWMAATRPPGTRSHPLPARPPHSAHARSAAFIAAREPRFPHSGAAGRFRLRCRAPGVRRGLEGPCRQPGLSPLCRSQRVCLSSQRTLLLVRGCTSILRLARFAARASPPARERGTSSQAAASPGSPFPWPPLGFRGVGWEAGKGGGYPAGEGGRGGGGDAGVSVAFSVSPRSE